MENKSRYSTELPIGFTSWIDLYNSIKPKIEPTHDIIELAYHDGQKKNRFKIHYIKSMALDELVEGLKKRTVSGWAEMFDDDCYRLIEYLEQNLGIQIQGTQA